MFRILFVMILGGALFAACSKTTHRKTPGGMPYQLHKGKGGAKILAGNYIKVHITQKVKDSVYFTTQGQLPIYIPVGQVQPYDISETFTNLRVGDSIVALQMMDTFIARNPAGLPKEFKNGDRIMTYLKVLDVFASDSLRIADEKKMMDIKLAEEISLLEKYAAEKNMKVEKTPSGALVEVLTPGTGNLVDSGNYISVNYTGKTLAGVTFDSNVDTAFHHVEPYSFTVGAGAMIKGFDEAMRFLRKGGSGRVLIPSILAYGGRPGSPNIKPYENLVFDISIVNVQERDPAIRNQPSPKIDMPQPR